jgi:hypothetical protein
METVLCSQPTGMALRVGEGHTLWNVATKDILCGHVATKDIL